MIGRPPTTSPSVCPYCRTRYMTQAELVDHLTAGAGCPRRNNPSPKPRPGRVPLSQRAT